MTMDTIHVYVGASPNGEDAESLMVLEHTAKAVTTGVIQFHYMMMSKDPDSPWFCGEGGWNTERWPTPFSAFRWGIPWAHQYAGRAIYMDSDMIIQRDLRELWSMELQPGTIVAAKTPDRFCVALWDCAAVGELVRKGRLPDTATARSDPLYHEKMKRGFNSNPHLITLYDNDWNNLDGEDRPLTEAKILHYTDMSCQPHGKHALARLEKEGKKHWFDGTFRPHWRQDVQDLFDVKLAEAVAAGYTPEKMPRTDYGPYVKLSQAGYKANHGFDR